MVVDAFLCAFLGLAVLASPMTPGKDSAARSKLHALLDETWEFELREDPLFATSVGDHRFDGRLPSVRVTDHARRAQARRKLLDRLRAIDPAGLDETDRDSHALMRVKLEDFIREFELHHYRFPINADSGFHMELAQLVRQMPFDTTVATTRSTSLACARSRSTCARTSSCCARDSRRAGPFRRWR